MLLWNVLAFLGQMPPQGMAGASCGELLQWGAEHFDVARIPLTGGELRIS